MKRDAILFVALALIAAAVAVGDTAGNVGEAALILSLVFLVLSWVAMFIVRPVPR